MIDTRHDQTHRAKLCYLVFSANAASRIGSDRRALGYVDLSNIKYAHDDLISLTVCRAYDETRT
jgi:hypothetical protein